VKAVIQRVSSASVLVEGETVGAIGAGYMILLGVAREDTEGDADLLAAKIAKLRLFESPPGRMHLSILETGGSALVVPQFTLQANCRRGNRPSFDAAEHPGRAEELYEYFVESLEKAGVPVETGRFAANMKVALVNDGPVTILLDAADFRKRL